jgi:ketosteroid isomerase-like protein
MNMRANGKANGTDVYRGRFARRLSTCVTLLFISLMVKSAIAAPEDEVQATFDRFVAAQNAHDIRAVESLLLGSPNFLWITRGTPIWGHDSALKHFTALYDGTWRLDPEPSGLKITMIGDGVAQIYVPIIFTIGAPGQPPQQTRFLMNQVLIKTPDGWRVSSILPIPAPAQ